MGGACFACRGPVRDSPRALSPASCPAPLETDPLEATQLFETGLEKRTRLGPEATLMLESELGLLWLKTGKLAEAKAVVESGKSAVEELQVRRFRQGRGGGAFGSPSGMVPAVDICKLEVGGPTGRCRFQGSIPLACQRIPPCTN